MGKREKRERKEEFEIRYQKGRGGTSGSKMAGKIRISYYQNYLLL